MNVLATLVLSVSLVQGQSLPSRGVAEIDAILQRAVDQWTVPGVVAIVATKDQILYHNAFEA